MIWRRCTRGKIRKIYSRKGLIEEGEKESQTQKKGHNKYTNVNNSENGVEIRQGKINVGKYIQGKNNSKSIQKKTSKKQ